MGSLEPEDTVDTAHTERGGEAVPGPRPTWLYPALPGKPYWQCADGRLPLLYITRGSALGASCEGRHLEIVSRSPCEQPLMLATPCGYRTPVVSCRCLRLCAPATVLKGTSAWLWVSTTVALSVCPVTPGPSSTRVVSVQMRGRTTGHSQGLYGRGGHLPWATHVQNQSLAPSVASLGTGGQILATRLNSDEAERNKQLKSILRPTVSFTRGLPKQFLQMQFYPKFNLFMQDVAMFPCPLPCHLCEVPPAAPAKDS